MTGTGSTDHSRGHAPPTRRTWRGRRPFAWGCLTATPYAGVASGSLCIRSGTTLKSSRAPCKPICCTNAHCKLQLLSKLLNVYGDHVVPENLLALYN
eukprot:12893749-Prorocentrum_lima.AAC.1